MYLGTEGVFMSHISFCHFRVHVYPLWFHPSGNRNGKIRHRLGLGHRRKIDGRPSQGCCDQFRDYGHRIRVSVANVCTTGTFTIPLMKSIGYKPYFAGAVEASRIGGWTDNASP